MGDFKVLTVCRQKDMEEVETHFHALLGAEGGEIARQPETLQAEGRPRLSANPRSGKQHPNSKTLIIYTLLNLLFPKYRSLSTV